MPKHYDLDPLDSFPTHFTDALQEVLSGLTNFGVRIKPGDATKVEVPAGANNAQVGLSIEGQWRWITANVERVSLGGGARTLDLYATASANTFGSTVISGHTVETDTTTPAFALAFVEHNAAAPAAALTRKVAEAVWDGAAFTAIRAVVAGQVQSLVTNADVEAAAAIAYSKLALTGAIVNADVAAAAGIVRSKLNFGSGLVNADIATGAAIAYAKLALTLAIVNGDISAAAAIARSKLDFGSGLVNADLAAAAAIARSKLNFGSGLVDADIAAAAAIGGDKIAAATGFTALTMAAGIVNTGGSGARRDLATVARLHGGIENTSGGAKVAGTLLATVPAGFRPSQIIAVTASSMPGGTGGTPVTALIDTGGAITLGTASLANLGQLYFDGITYAI